MVEVASSRHERLIVAVGTAGCFLALIGLIQVVPWPAADWRTGLVVLSVVSLAAYGIHRYERVRLDLVRGVDQ